METYWCSKENSIIDMMNGKKIPIAPTPCRKSECDIWRDGKCCAVPSVVIGVMYTSLSIGRNSAEQSKTILLTNAVQQW